MRWQRVPDLGCHDTETARTITHSPSTWHNHVILVSGAKSGMKWNGDDRYKDVMEIRWWSATDTIVCHQCNFEDDALRHGQPVKCAPQCRRDLVVPSDVNDVVAE